jgi:endonuclease YncB( thermonuclease family)
MRKSDATFFKCPIPFPGDKYRVKIKRAVDGDTVVMLVDRGDWDDSTWELRLQGFNAPERFSGEKRELGRDWWRALTKICEGHWALLTTYLDREKYGRLLGDLAVWDPDRGLIDVHLLLFEQGFDITEYLTDKGVPVKPMFAIIRKGEE